MGLLKFIFGSYNIEDSIKKLVSSNEIVVKDLSDKEYQKLLGKKSSIKKKYTCHLPLIYWAKATTYFSYKGMAGTFDLQGWNTDMKLYNKTVAENKERKKDVFKLSKEEYVNKYNNGTHASKINLESEWESENKIKEQM